MGTDAPQWLEEADACHDDDPARGAELLGRIPPADLPAGDRPRYAFLLNHVFGEKFGRWPEAHARQQALLSLAGDEAGPALWRHAGAAARLAGDMAGEARCRAGLGAAAGCPESVADALIGLGAAGFAVPSLPAAQAGAAARAAALALEAVHEAPAAALDGAFAAAASNLASHLAERPLPDLDDPVLAAALDRLARDAQRFWRRAGGWVQHERAHYLCAVAAGALGEAGRAAEEARAGLALLDAHDAERTEEVDRAFLEQELAAALAQLGDAGAAEAAAMRASALKAAFAEPGLVEWFDGRAARHALLRGRHGPR